MHARNQLLPAGVRETDEQKTAMGAGFEAPCIREIEILGDEEPVCCLGCFPDVRIVLAGQALLPNRIGIVARVTELAGKRKRDVLV